MCDPILVTLLKMRSHYSQSSLENVTPSSGTLASYYVWFIILVPRASILLRLSQRFGHPRVLGIPIPISLAFWASPVGDAQNADRFDFA